MLARYNLSGRLTGRLCGRLCGTLCDRHDNTLAAVRLLLNNVSAMPCEPEHLNAQIVGVSVSGTAKEPQRTFATKMSPNFRVNFLVRLASKPLF